MLIQFKVGNFLSFKDFVTFSMVATPRKEHENNNVFAVGNKLKLLKSAVIYGANASGKSNLFKAIRFFKDFTLSSSKESQIKEKIHVTNFKLSSETEGEPSYFEAIFIHEGIRYRYGFQVDRKRVYREWCFYVPKRQEAKLFIREKDSFEIGTHFKEAKGLEEKTRENALFLSVVAQFNGEISTRILRWIKRMKVVSGLNDATYLGFTLSRMRDENFKRLITDMLKKADLGIEDLNVQKIKIDQQTLPPNMPEELKSKILEGTASLIKITAAHKKYDKEDNFLSLEQFDLDSEESEGTKKIFALSAPIIDTLRKGKVLMIDELDARLHPALTRFLVGLFHSNDINTKNAQLIFASHNTNLLDRKLFRRDQIWFTAKTRVNYSDLFSLVEYKYDARKIRKDASYEKDYLLGKYGAVPFIKNILSIFEEKNGT